ncbi:MAG: NAD(P)/FAD-dependent oxidoreductase [Thermoleophilaceae bacterium]|nr:NAD(P)/FAD-dependent oxidoreductase [Thermoleophilaceae bacterium]
MRSLRREDMAIGAAAGLVSGLVLVALTLWQGMAISGLLGLTGRGPAEVALQLLLATLAGAGLAGVLGYAAQGYSAMVSGGLLAGLLLWIAGPLTVAPLLEGRGPTWSLREAGDVFSSLIADLLFGALTAFLFYMTLAVRRRGESPSARGGPSEEPRVRVVIAGGGFAGVSVAQGLERHFARDPEVDVTLVSSSNYLLFTPMLAEVASSAVEPAHISAPVRASSARTRFRRGVVQEIDPASGVVQVRTGGSLSDQELPYDHLVLALGSVADFRDLPGVEANSFTLKTLEDAVALRNHVISLLEEAEGEAHSEERRRQLTFVVAGGGFAGTEAIAELFDLVHGVLHYYPSLRAEELRFVLVHSRDRILPEVGERLASYALEKLRARGIDFELERRVESATAGALRLEGGHEIHTHTIVWTAGNRPAPVLAPLSEQLEGKGAIPVEPTLQVVGHPSLWALGDCASIPDPRRPGASYPPTAQHALREGKLVAGNVAAAIRGEEPKAFAFEPIGVLVALGRRTAVAEIRGRQFSGLAAWIMWRGIYLAKLPGLERKLRVLLDWTLDLFFTRDVVLTGQDEHRARDTVVEQRVAEGAR